MAEIAPCFVTEADGRRTDVVCPACRHAPLLPPRSERRAPWPVTWIDPAPAIARRVTQLLGPGDRSVRAEAPVLGAFTKGEGLSAPLRASLAGRGLAEVTVDAMPLALQ